jgi:hypothetical protein
MSEKFLAKKTRNYGLAMQSQEPGLRHTDPGAAPESLVGHKGPLAAVLLFQFRGVALQN